MKALCVLFAALLAGCASMQPPAPPVVVKVPYYVPCVKEVPQRPSYETPTLPATADDGTVALALARDWVRSRGYEPMLEAIVQGCANPPPLPTQ